MTEVWQWATEVVADWFLCRRAPRDAIAENRVLRTEPLAVRAGAARAAQAVLGAWRRLEYALGGETGLNELSPHARAMALVLAREVETDAMLAAAAGRCFAAATRRGLDFAPVLGVRERIDAIADADLRFAIQHSVPDWVVPFFREQFGNEAGAVAAALGDMPPRTLRTNTLRVASRDELARELASEGIATQAAAYGPLALHVDGDADLFATAAWRRGAFEQQDEASQLAALVVAPPPGGRVLDLCAGSGGKTLALAAAMRNRGEILATDVHAGRLEDLRTRARRAGVGNVRALVVDEVDPGSVASDFAARADRILVDAPCSGIGSWRRRPEARWGLARPRLDLLVATQDRLLDTTAKLLRPGARIVYETCSLLEHENERRIEAALHRWPGLEVVRIAEILGSDCVRAIADATGTFLSLRPDRHGCDGFFAAVLRCRRGS